MTCAAATQKSPRHSRSDSRAGRSRTVVAHRFPGSFRVGRAKAQRGPTRLGMDGSMWARPVPDLPGYLATWLNPPADRNPTSSNDRKEQDRSWLNERFQQVQETII